MNDQKKTREELLAEIDQLRFENETLKAGYKNHLEETLNESEKIWQLLIAATPDFLILLNTEGKSLFFNHVPKGYCAKELVGISAYDILPPDAVDFFKQKMDDCVNTMQTQFFEYNGIGDHGSTRVFEQYLVPITSPKHNILIMAVSRDITERKKVELELELGNKELHRVNSEKDKFFSIIAHDLRGPFNCFLGLSRIMAEELPELTRTEIEMIAVNMRNSATNLYRLLDNLLQWAGIQQGLIPFNPTIFKLSSIIDENKTMVTEPAKTKRIEITCDIPDDIIVFADRNIMRTVIWNLVSNAVKFTPPEGKISVSAKINDDKSVKISVQDTGIGMKQELIESLFKLDVKTSRRGTEGELSTGLGLLLCKDLLEKHNSKLHVESKEGEGSIFSFSHLLQN